jgi:hypothetical protein
MKDDFWFYLLAAWIFLVIGIRAAFVYAKFRTKYNLATLIVFMTLSVGTILGYFYLGKLLHGVESTVKIFSSAVVIISLIIFLFYTEIKQFFNRRKPKRK